MLTFQYLMITLFIVGVLVAIIASPMGRTVDCFAQESIVRMHSSAGQACGRAIPEITLPEPVVVPEEAADEMPLDEASGAVVVPGP